MGDIDAMSRMIGALFELEPDFAADPAKQRRALKALLASPSAAAFVAEEGGDPLGMVTVQLTLSTAEGGPSGLLEDLFVVEGARRRGVASALVGAVEAWCAEAGATRVQLLADRGNERALRFYEAAGYLSTRMIAIKKPIGPGGREAHRSS